MLRKGNLFTDSEKLREKCNIFIHYKLVLKQNSKIFEIASTTQLILKGEFVSFLNHF